MKYKVSVIIPNYNNSRYIDECLSSITSQSLDFKDIEIIFIDDCSTDNSLEVIEKYKDYSNIKVLKNEQNKGVSYSRNAGIKIATGKYIMFLDSDDYLSESAILNIYNFFETHENSIDIVAYPICNVHPDKQIIEEKYNYYNNGTNIYDINEYPYLMQTTINVMIKNNKKYYFNEKQQFAEDQKFNCQIIMEKEKIGYVEEALYFYRRHNNSTSLNNQSPYYCFEQIISHNEWLVKEYQKNGHLPEYIQGMILNTLNWRLLSDFLYPYHYNEADFKKAQKRIDKLFAAIDTEYICNFKQLPLNRKLHILRIKQCNITTKNIQGLLNSYADNIKISENKVFGISIKRYKIFNNKLYIMGTILCGIFEFIKPDLLMDVIYNNGKTKEIKLDLSESTSSFNKSRQEVNVLYCFQEYIDLKNIKYIEFKIKVGNTFYKTKLSFFNLNNKGIYSKDYIITYATSKNALYIRKSSIKNKIKYILRKGKELQQEKKIYLSWLYYLLHRNNLKIWLYHDFNSLDNGYYQFLHDINKNDGIKRYYVYNSDSNESVLNEMDKKNKKNYIKFGSLKHKKLYINSEKILVSNSSLNAYCPLKENKKEYYDLTKSEIIYLQHGILHASLLQLYGKENCEIDKIVISSDFEEQNLINNYGYQKTELYKVGMPRFDMKNTLSPTNRIVFVPSWRLYLSGILEGFEWSGDKSTLLNSNYFKNIEEFINSKRLIQILEENDLYLDLKLHPNFGNYEGVFTSKSKRINITIDKVDLGDYKILITDFSSFQFDYLQYERPVVYFLPDEQEFKAGLHTYRELDLKYEDAFGELYYDSESVINKLQTLINNNYQDKKIYQKRIRDFYNLKPNCREALYEKLIDENNN